jgi:hypothetical protein
MAGRIKISDSRISCITVIDLTESSSGCRQPLEIRLGLHHCCLGASVKVSIPQTLVSHRTETLRVTLMTPGRTTEAVVTNNAILTVISFM